MPGRARDRNEAWGFGMGLHKHSQSQPHLLDQCFSKKPPLTSCRHAHDTWPLWGPNPDTGSPDVWGPGRWSALLVWMCILKFEKHTMTSGSTSLLTSFLLACVPFPLSQCFTKRVPSPAAGLITLTATWTGP